MAVSGDQSDLERELIALRAEIVRAFEDVDGPPPVTQSVARVCDDNPTADFEKGRREQRHQTHWTRVLADEIERFHDIWLWLDDRSFQFYIPAYMVHALDGFIAEHEVAVSEPDWIVSAGWDDPRNASSLSTEQQTCLQKFLKLIADANHVRAYPSFTQASYEKWEQALRSS